MPAPSAASWPPCSPWARRRTGCCGHRRPASTPPPRWTPPGHRGPTTQRRRPPVMRYLRTHPLASLIRVAEDFDEPRGRAAPATLLTGRVVPPRTPPLGVDTADEAVSVAMDVDGTRTLGRVASLLGWRSAGPAPRWASWSMTTRPPEDRAPHRILVRQRPRWYPYGVSRELPSCWRRGRRRRGCGFGCARVDHAVRYRTVPLRALWAVGVSLSPVVLHRCADLEAATCR